ncbi:PREDICTED: sorting nexin-19-like, partial [Nanorana parkeri]|uniref:sorting nexin-19-like n=1 Tax=Nanorana parkeri TaxID=125878 RepID=UPI0008550C0D
PCVFVQQLCAVPEIASSEEVQEFLALNTDARIAFVKKPFLVSRIDKIVVNAIVDTLKTAFPRSEPQSPTDELSENEVDGKSQNDKRSTKGLSAVALEVLWLVMREQWSWLCTDNMQKVTRVLCGSLIQRWLEVQVDNVTCMQRWALYLRLLRQAIWPGGALRTQPRPPRTRTQRDAAYDQALQSLMGIIPDLVQEMLGVQKCCQAWKSILDSLQHPPITRHLLYCVWDILLESVIAAPAS